MRRRGRGARVGRLPLAAGILVGLVSGLVLMVTHQTVAPVVPEPEAVRAALHDRTTERLLAGSHWTRVTVNSLDDQLEHVTFFAGGRLVESVTVDRSRRVQPGMNGRVGAVPYGNWIAYEPAVLIALAVLFALMTAVTPWRRLRNLDVAACLSFVAPVLLLRHEYIDASVLAALPGLLYLFARCAFRGFAGPAEPAPATPLLGAVTPRLDPARRVRWLRALLVVFALVFLMVGVGSPDALDVIYAVMEGATRIVHGVLPYGHMPPGMVHGDTYPILSYALYTPLALFAPVSSTWDSVDAGLAVSSLMAFVAAWAIFRGPAGRRPKGRAARPAEAEEAGLRVALAWLAFPPLLITASTGTTDVMLAAMLAGALLLWRRPAACSGMLALAGWFKLAPFALLPIWLAPLRGRRLASAVAAVALASLPPVALLLALGGVHGLPDMVHAMSFQFSRGSLQSAWSVVGIEPLQPLAQAGVLGLIAAAVVRLRREPALAHDRVRMAALAGAILLGLQLADDYWAFLYLAWIVPLLSFSLLAEQRRAAEAAEAADAAGAAGAATRVAGSPDPAAAIAA